MAKCGCVPIPIMEGSCSRKLLKWLAAKACGVVQDWAPGGTYCRSLSQMVQRKGGDAEGSYCVPQAVQIWPSIGCSRTDACCPKCQGLFRRDRRAVNRDGGCLHGRPARMRRP